MLSTLPSVTSYRKSEITHRNVTLCNVFFMADDEIQEQWRRAKTPRERLIWARAHWQSKAGAINGTPTDAAHSLGMKPGTYNGYERPEDSSKHTPLSHQRAIQFGRKFRVSWSWLLSGEGSPFEGQLPEPQARVVEAMSAMTEDQQKSLVEFVETFGQRKAG